MKRKLFTLGIAAAFLIGASFITACGNTENTENHEQHEHMEGDEHSEMEHKNMDMDENQSTDQAADATYACPMHPEITGKEGDKCSKCGMALVKVEDDHSGHDHE